MVSNRNQMTNTCIAHASGFIEHVILRQEVVAQDIPANKYCGIYIAGKNSSATRSIGLDIAHIQLMSLNNREDLFQNFNLLSNSNLRTLPKEARYRILKLPISPKTSKCEQAFPLPCILLVQGRMF